MQKDNIKQCPLEQTYLFKTVCTVTSCKYHSPVVDDKCLILANVVNAEEKSITDTELLRYKFSDTELSEKEVSNIRKKAVDRVKNIVQLYNLISFIRENYSKKEGPTYDEENSLISELLNRKPLSITRLGFEPWMFTYFVDEKLVSNVCGPRFKIKTALFLKQKEYVDLINLVTTTVGENTHAP